MTALLVWTAMIFGIGIIFRILTWVADFIADYNEAVRRAR